MSYKDKKNNNVEYDDMKIKSHLNTSLDLSKINVSEDLINRTLEAIRQQPVNSEEKNNTINTLDQRKKVIPWGRVVRSVAGVAAAGLVIFVGLSLLELPGARKDSKTEMTAPESSDIAMDQAKEEYTALSEEESTNMAATDIQKDIGVKEDAATEYTIMGSGAENTEMKDTADAKMAEPSDTSAVTTEILAQFNFEAISRIAPEQLESLTITSNKSGAAVTLTNQIEILDFYNRMNQYTFTYTEEGVVNPNYSVELITPLPEQALYTLEVGERITVRYLFGQEESESFYLPSDYEGFLSELENFFKDYSE